MTYTTERLGNVLPAASRWDAGPMRVDVGGSTHRGTTRSENQDNYLIGELWQLTSVRQSSLPDVDVPTSRICGHLLAVADGMGAHEAGALASREALEGLREVISATGERSPAARLEEAVRRAEWRVNAIPSSGHRRPGTTLTVALVRWPKVHIAHVGDSRAYLVRKGQAIRLTDDHTLADAMRRNASPPGDASRFEHILLNAIGGDNEPARIDSSHCAMEPGDTLLLCSDGLVSNVEDAEIGSLAQRHDPALLSEALVQLSVERGVRDNVSVVNLRVADTAVAADQESQH